MLLFLLQLSFAADNYRVCERMCNRSKSIPAEECLQKNCMKVSLAEANEVDYSLLEALIQDSVKFIVICLAVIFLITIIISIQLCCVYRKIIKNSWP